MIITLELAGFEQEYVERRLREMNLHREIYTPADVVVDCIRDAMFSRVTRLDKSDKVGVRE